MFEISLAGPGNCPERHPSSSCKFQVILGEDTLPETNSSAFPKVGHPEKRYHLPTMQSQGLS